MQEPNTERPSLQSNLLSHLTDFWRAISSEELNTWPQPCNPIPLSGHTTKIKEEGAQYWAFVLQFNSSLTSLNLGGNHIWDGGVQHLESALQTNSTLASLNLNLLNLLNLLEDTGAQHLSQALQSNSSLTDLNLRNNEIDDTGAQYLASALQSNSTIIILNLGGNRIGAQ
jgi:Ran GTPase-activating protein (RanGAP) involved in mRNA processing and transport